MAERDPCSYGGRIVVQRRIYYKETPSPILDAHNSTMDDIDVYSSAASEIDSDYSESDDVDTFIQVCVPPPNYATTMSNVLE